MLSVIIVNYNVKHYIDQCLRSVFIAARHTECEVFVVDNNSVDGSNALIKEKYPEVTLIENKNNVGFSTANNQAIKLCKGEYVLLLNPDTIVEEDTFKKIVDFMNSHQDAGGLGVKMIDGKGNYLPESKRGLPVPSVAFYKMVGLSKLFPRSKHFGRYHLGYLNRDQVHQIDVLSGAFMLLRKSVLDKIGLLDETFFMYGEDIDLSYRITLAGYKNYYYPDTTIVHYKGESTKKGSINYVMVFYKAMIVFATKHFSKRNAWIFSLLINFAIYFRAAIAILARLFKNALRPVIDGAVIYAGFVLLMNIWESVRFHEEGYYPATFMYYVLPAYSLIWIFCIYYWGGYSKTPKLLNLVKGIFAGALILLVLYALVSDSFRFSRAILLFGFLWTLIVVPLVRFILSLSGASVFKLHSYKKKRIVIAGSEPECTRVSDIINEANLNSTIIGFVALENSQSDKSFLGQVSNLTEVARVHKVDEIIFCSKDIPTQMVINNMIALSDSGIDYKIAGPDSIAVIGSNSIHTSGDIYMLDINSIGKELNKRNKRVFDVATALLIMVSSPLLIFITVKPLGLIRNIFAVLFGFRSWVGYFRTEWPSGTILPVIKKGILPPVPNNKIVNLSDEQKSRVNLLYAKDYKLFNDFLIIIRSLRQLGNSN